MKKRVRLKEVKPARRWAVFVSDLPWTATLAEARRSSPRRVAIVASKAEALNRAAELRTVQFAWAEPVDERAGRVIPEFRPELDQEALTRCLREVLEGGRRG